MSARSSASSSSWTVFLYLTKFMLACSSCSNNSIVSKTLWDYSPQCCSLGWARGQGDVRPPPLVFCRPSSYSEASPPAPASAAGSSDPLQTGTAAPLTASHSCAKFSPSLRAASAPSPAPSPGPSPALKNAALCSHIYSAHFCYFTSDSGSRWIQAVV